MSRNQTAQLKVGLGVVLALVAVVMILAALPAAARPAGPEFEQSTSREPAAPAATLANLAAGDAGDFLLSQVDSTQDDPAIAYNSDDDQFLLVWSEASDIYGQVFSDKGVPQGTSFPICTNDNIQMNPTAAYNSTAQDFLVVWTDLRNGLGDIYGQRVNPDGSLPNSEDPAANYAISTATGYQQYPTLAYNEPADEYLVVWNDNRDAVDDLDIYGQRVDADGTLLGNNGPAVNLVISTASGHQSKPVIAYNPLPADNYLVVWDDERNGNFRDIYGQLVNSDGTRSGADLAISTGNNDQADPAIAYNSQANEYLVVWGDRRVQSNSPDIYGQRISAAGALQGDNFAISDAWNSQFYPAVAYNADHDQYLVIWKDNRGYNGDDVYGRRVGSDGTLAPQGDFAISTAIEDQMDPAVAYSSSSDQFMVVWEDHRAGEYAGHIHGQRVWWPGLLVGHEFSVSSQGTRQNPAVAYDTREHLFLAVWADNIDGDYDIYGQLYHRDHYPVSPVFPITNLEGDQITPAVAYNQHDRNYLVVFQGPSGIGGQFITTLGTPEGSSFLIRVGAVHSPAVAYTANGPSGERGFVVLVIEELYDGDNPAIISMQVSNQGRAYGVTHFGLMNGATLGWPEIAYNSTDNEFLAVWQSLPQSGSWEILGIRLDYDATPLGTTLGIATAAMGQIRPAASYNPDDNQYLVVWEDFRNTTDFDIYAQRIDATNDNLLGVNTPIATSSSASNQRRPDIIYAETMGRYRIVWQDDRNTGTLGWDLWGQWLGADGSNLGTSDGPLIRYLGDQQEPAIAYSQESLYNQALTIWEDNRVGSDIYGSFAALDNDPPVARFNRFRRIGRAGQTFIFNAWPSRDDNTPRGDLQVRWDLNDDGAWDPNITDKFITYTLASAGVHTVTLGVWDSAFLSNTISHRIVVLPATRAPLAAPTATLTVSPTWGLAGTTFEFNGNGSGGSGTLEASWDWEDDGNYDTDWSTDLQVTHTYTVAGDYTIRLMIKDDSGTTDAALQNITVVPNVPTELELTPQVVTMTPGEAVRFRASGRDQYGNQNFHPEVTWSVTDELAGTISAGGVFTATTHTAVYTDVIQLQSNGVTQFATVTIRWPYQIYLPLTLRSP